MRKGYAFPPSSLIGRVLKKVQRNQTQVLLVIPGNSSDVSRKTDFDPTSTGSFNGLKNGKAPINRKAEIKFLVWKISRKSYLQREFEKRLQSLLQVHYKSTGEEWDSWCSRKQFHPISGPLNSVLDFVAQLFHSGLERRTFQ